MDIVVLQGATIEFGSRLILDGVDWRITDRTRAGLVGANGGGKTTLLKAIIGNLPLSAGARYVRADLRIGYLPQISEIKDSVSVVDAVMCGNKRLWTLNKRIGELTHNGLKTSEQFAEFERLSAEFNIAGGASFRQRAEEILARLGFHKDMFCAPVNTLSGGERNRVAIARLVMSDPELIVMDEPTTHIDYDGLIWLGNFLRNSSVPYVVVAHDRYFLDIIAEEIVELHGKKLYFYKGNWSLYQSEREKRIKREQKLFEQQQTYIKRTEEFIRRNLAGQNTKQAQSRRRWLERMERLNRPPDERVFTLRLTPDRRGGDTVLKIKELSIGFPGKELIEPFSTIVSRGDKIGIIGPNGCGKSTLLKTIIAREKPLHGFVEWGADIDVGYFSQELSELNGNESPFDNIMNYRPSLTDNDIRGLLALFAITGDNVFRPISTLSGGEKSKLALLRLLLSGANLLILDEPNNFLDIPSREALEDAIALYDGTVILVSHDRYFLRRTAERIWGIERHKLHIMDGGIDYYLEKRTPSPASVPTTRKKKQKHIAGKTKTKPNIKKLTRELTELERQIAELEQQIAALSESLGVPAVAASKERTLAVLTEQDRLKEQLNLAMNRWEYIFEMSERYRTRDEE